MGVEQLEELVVTEEPPQSVRHFVVEDGPGIGRFMIRIVPLYLCCFNVRTTSCTKLPLFASLNDQVPNIKTEKKILFNFCCPRIRGRTGELEREDMSPQ